AGFRSTSRAAPSTGTMSPTASPKAGSLRRRGACSKLAADERISLRTAPPSDQPRRADCACCTHCLRRRRVDRVEKQQRGQDDAHYVEMGADRRGGGTYVLRYRWEGGGLFGGRSVRLVGLSR